jgi:hypothetical protein
MEASLQLNILDSLFQRALWFGQLTKKFTGLARIIQGSDAGVTLPGTLLSYNLYYVK